MKGNLNDFGRKFSLSTHIPLVTIRVSEFFTNTKMAQCHDFPSNFLVEIWLISALFAYTVVINIIYIYIYIEHLVSVYENNNYYRPRHPVVLHQCSLINTTQLFT